MIGPTLQGPEGHRHDEGRTLRDYSQMPRDVHLARNRRIWPGDYSENLWLRRFRDVNDRDAFIFCVLHVQIAFVVDILLHSHIDGRLAAERDVRDNLALIGGYFLFVLSRFGTINRNKE